MTQRKYFVNPDNWRELIGWHYSVDLSKEYCLTYTFRQNDVSVKLFKNNEKVLNTTFHDNSDYLFFETAGDINKFIDWVYDNLIENKEDKLPPEQDYIETAGVFWLVWTPQGGHPKYRHSTRELAETESSRLAKQHPEKEFYVLKCVSKAFAETRINKVNFE